MLSSVSGVDPLDSLISIADWDPEVNTSGNLCGPVLYRPFLRPNPMMSTAGYLTLLLKSLTWDAHAGSLSMAKQCPFMRTLWKPTGNNVL
jgi:hypothetical protein